jgi:MFS family permease
VTEAAAQHLSISDRERIYRRNFFLFLLDGILFIVAINTIGATTVIPDFVRRLTDSEILIGFSGSMFDIGWTLPQLFVARYIVRSARKKWWFVGPNIPVRFVILTFSLLVVLLGKERPQAILAAFLICYGIAAVGDGLVGVPWTDLTGTSLDNRWRARMFGFMSAISGIIILLIISPTIGFILGDQGPEFPNNYALLFAISIIPPLFFHELPGGKAVEKLPALREFLPDLGRVLRTDAQFRAMVITRMLTTLFAMAAPFYIGFATVTLGLSSTAAVPRLLMMQTLGSIGGAFAYTWLGARNNLLYIRLALAGSMLLPISALLATLVGPLPLYFGFLMSGLGLSNLMFGYQNWVIAHASPDERPIYAGLFNTITALISLVAPLIAGTIAQRIGYEALFAVALVMILSAQFVALRHLKNPAPDVIQDLVAAD